jgi:nucleotide-binding universal stress UspA family protein/hemerythrin-like domain-containing protein
MYKHLLVPMDGTPLSAINASRAVALARPLGARITFFTATADFGATDDGALLRSIDPVDFAERAQGDGDSLLGKAIVEAQAHGVPCSRVARVCDRPAEAILKAGEELHCDLIVMASHGQRGMRTWLHGSQTEKVLRQARIAVLVTRVERNDPLTPAELAVGVILDEHRSLGVVVNCMRSMVADAVRGEPLELHALKQMLQYLEEFPEQLHHPKEELHLHVRLRERCPAAGEMLAELQNQHSAETNAVQRLAGLLERCGVEPEATLQTLQEALEAFAKSTWDHMALEERELIPLAQRHLNDDDWRLIAAAFQSNDDPRFGRYDASELRQLFTRIARLAPR